MNTLNLRWKTAQPLLQDADILLFRSKGLIAKLIRSFSGGGLYSHCGLVSIIRNHVELLEVREFKGGRAISLEREVHNRPGEIDVYRCLDKLTRSHYFKDEGKVIEETVSLDREAVVRCFRDLLGAGYNYMSIWSIARRQMAFLRLFSGEDSMDDKQVATSSHICSSAVAHCFNGANFDLFPRKSDSLVTPNDFSRNPLLSYIMTLVP